VHRKKTDPQYKILRDYWDEWINTKGKEIMVKSRDGLKTRTINSCILRVRKEDEGQVSAAGCDDKQEEDDVSYDSDPFNETIDIGNWRNKRVGKLQRQSHDGEGEDEDEDEDEDKDKDEGDDDNNNNYMNASGLDDHDDKEDDDNNSEDEENSYDGLQRELESREAEAAGMMTRNTKKEVPRVNNTTKKRKVNDEPAKEQRGQTRTKGRR
jgi:hypothetical protein